MKFNDIIEEASQEIVQQFNSFFEDVNSKKEISNYGSLRMREIYPSREGYSMQFHLKPEYAKLKNQDKEIKYVMRLLKEVGQKHSSSVKVKRENVTNNQALIKIIFKEEEKQDGIQKSDPRSFS